MPYARDTLTVLIQRAIADIAARLGGSNPFLRRSVLNVLAQVAARFQNDQLGYLDWISRQSVPFTAEDEFLLGWAGLKGLTQKQATYSSGPVIFTGVPTTGVVPNGQQVSLGTQVYAVVTGGPIGMDGTGTFTVTALTAGDADNADAGAILNLVTPASGVALTATIGTGGLVGGADVESLDDLRTRMLEAFANPPQGGSLADYVTWALQVPGVTRAWAGGYAFKGAGTVSVFFMMDQVEAAFAGIPQGTNGVATAETRDTAATGDQLLVANHIYPLRPVTALVYGCAPVAVPLNLTLSEVPVDTTIRAGITAALAAALIREASPGGVYTPDPTNKPTGVVRLSHLDDAISAVPGLDHYVLASPTADVTVASGAISTPGTITYL